MIKLILRDISANLRDQLGKKFVSFMNLLDGNTTVFLHSYQNELDINNINIQDILGFAAVTENAEYCLLEEVEVRVQGQMQYKKIYQELLADVFYFVSDKDMPLMTNHFTPKEKNIVVPILEFCAAKYGVYVMEEKEYLEMRNKSFA